MVEIKSINIKIGEGEHTLTLEEARELKFALDDIFDKHYDRPINPYIPPNYLPYYQDRWWETTGHDTTPIYCSNNIEISADAREKSNTPIIY